MNSDKLKNITDEQLAAFVDGNLSETENEAILDALQTDEDLKTLVMVLEAKKLAEEADEELDDMPDIDTSSGKRIKIHPFESLPMAGFLGNDTDEPETSADDKKE